MEVASCQGDGCSATMTIRGRVDGMKASQAGWYRSRRTGQVFCPACIPPWVTAWRERKAAERRVAAG